MADSNQVEEGYFAGNAVADNDGQNPWNRGRFPLVNDHYYGSSFNLDPWTENHWANNAIRHHPTLQPSVPPVPPPPSQQLLSGWSPQVPTQPTWSTSSQRDIDFDFDLEYEFNRRLTLTNPNSIDHQSNSGFGYNAGFRTPIRSENGMRDESSIMRMSVESLIDNRPIWTPNHTPTISFNPDFVYNYYRNNYVLNRTRYRYSGAYDRLSNHLEGNVYHMAKTQQGCRNLQRIFEEGRPERVHMIFSELKQHVVDLMKHQCGNLLIQKMFEVCNPQMINDLLVILVADEHRLIDVCTDSYGTRAVQKLLEYMTTQEQRNLVSSILTLVTLSLAKDTNGHHVLVHCFKQFPREDTKQILNVIADHCMEIATDKRGCCLLQHCNLGEDVEPLNRILVEITTNALFLSEHQYGNFVVQYIIGLGIEHAVNEILAQLSGRFVSLSINKYGSHVVEKCIKFCSEDQVMRIINEMVSSQDFLAVLQGPFGNYVAQSIVQVSKGSTRNTLINLINDHYPFLHSHPNGRWVLEKIGIHPHGRRLLDATRSRRNRM